jgi:flagellar motor switch protein FliN/FliY
MGGECSGASSGMIQPERICSGAYMNTLDQIEVDITVELGAASMPIHHLLRMGRGAVIELNSTENDPLRVYANNTLIAHGEVKVDEGRLTVEITEKVYKRS